MPDHSDFHDSSMLDDFGTTLVTTGSGFFGGMTKLMMTPSLLQASGVSLTGLKTVIIYAVATAVTGYLTKVGLDIGRIKVAAFINSFRSNNSEEGHSGE